MTFRANPRIALFLLLAACAGPESEETDTVVPPQSGTAEAVAAPQPAQADPAAAGGDVVRVAQADSAKTVTLRTGGRLELALESNPTTGYSWHRESGDTAVLAPDSSRYQATPSGPGVAGSGGTEILAFRGAQPGRTRLVLVYRQPWEGGASSDERWAADVVVQP